MILKKQRFYSLGLFILLTLPVWYGLLLAGTIRFRGAEVPLGSLRPAGQVSSVLFTDDALNIQFKNRGGIFFRRREIPDNAVGIRIHFDSVRSVSTGDNLRYLGGKTELNLLVTGEEEQAGTFYRKDKLKSGGSMTILFPYSRENIRQAEELFITFSPNLSDVPFTLEITSVEALTFPKPVYLPALLVEQYRFRLENRLQRSFPWVTLETFGFWNLSGLYLFIFFIILLSWKRTAVIAKRLFPVVFFSYLLLLAIWSIKEIQTLGIERTVLKREVAARDKDGFEAALYSMILSSPYQLETSLGRMVLYLSEEPGMAQTIWLYQGEPIQWYFLGTMLPEYHVRSIHDLAAVPSGESVLVPFPKALENRRFLEDEFERLKRINQYLLLRRK